MQNFSASKNGDTLHVECFGDWTNQTIDQFLVLLNSNQKLLVDVSKIQYIDSTAAMALYKIKDSLVGTNDDVMGLIALCEEYDVKVEPKPREQKSFAQSFNDAVDAGIVSLIDFIEFFGHLVYTAFESIKKPKEFRLKATLYHIQHNGYDAIPIILITTFLIGVVIAYQGSVQLERFGANIFIVEMVGIIATRELSPLIVAIVVAGRSASSFTAQIGVMKITQEIDAMKTMSFNPWDFLVLPRVVALVVAVPLLVFFGDVIAVFGGMVVAKGSLGISFEDFLNRFQETVALRHVIIGLAKAPVFGLIIALIGCYRGFQISSSTESVGKYTTISVVKAIFWVIAFDALVSVVLTELDL